MTLTCLKSHCQRLARLFGILLLLSLPTINCAAYGYSYCRALHGYVTDCVSPEVHIMLDDNFVPKTSGAYYKVKMQKNGSPFGYVEFNVNEDRSVVNAVWWQGSSFCADVQNGGASSYTVGTDGILLDGSSLVAGTATASVTYSFNKEYIIPENCSSDNHTYYHPVFWIKVGAKECSNGGQNAAAKTSYELHSLKFDLGLGVGTNPPSANPSWARLFLYNDEPSTNLSSPARLSLSATSDNTQLQDATGLRQVLSGQMLADIVTNNSYRYEIRLYAATNAGTTNAAGLYQPVGSPVKVVAVENPDGTTNISRLWLTEMAGNVTNSYQYTYASNGNSWEMICPSNLKKELIATTWAANRLSKTNLRSVFNPGSPDVLVYREQETFKDFGFGDVRVEQVIDPDGVARHVGFRIVKGGGVMVWPVLEKVDILRLELMTIDVQTPEVYTSKGVPVKVDGVAQIKVKDRKSVV